MSEEKPIEVFSRKLKNDPEKALFWFTSSLRIRKPEFSDLESQVPEVFKIKVTVTINDNLYEALGEGNSRRNAKKDAAIKHVEKYELNKFIPDTYEQETNSDLI